MTLRGFLIFSIKKKPSCIRSIITSLRFQVAKTDAIDNQI
jgi:hypothetical protein